MSMSISQADELRMLADGLQKLYENGANLTRVQVAGLATAVDAMRDAADTIESLQEASGYTSKSLLPCPHCGDEAFISKVSFPDGDTEYVFDCSCGRKIFEVSSKEKAVEAWNKRSRHE